MDYDFEGAARVGRMMEDNPAYRFLYQGLLEYCSEERALKEAMAWCGSHRTSQTQILSDAALVDTLARCGGLVRSVLVDGELYGGSLEELQADESLPEDAVVEVRVRATPEGLAAARAQAEERSLARLMAERPDRAQAFRAVIAWCEEGAGKTTRQLQELLREAELLETEEARGIDGLHASYFTGALEAVGALAWNGKAWVATERACA